jgi:uncharacterized membrane protein
LGRNDDLDSKVDFDAIIGNVLRYGITISTVLIAVGVIMILAGNTPGGLPASLGQLISIGYGRPTLSFVKLAAGVVIFNPISIIELGLLILLATPIVRVSASIILFAAEKDMTYVVLTMFVLAVLLFSIFVVGPIEAA